jgi:hypothetical protein
MLCVVSMFGFHTLPLAWLEVSTTLSPVQNVVGPFAEMVGAAGFGLTVTTVGNEVTVHPFRSVYVTSYAPEEFTVIEGVIAWLFHSIPVACDEVSVTLPPLQNMVGPFAEIVGAVGVGFTVTAIAFDVAEHPFDLVTVTLYEPEVLTEVVCVVAPLLQR